MTFDSLSKSGSGTDAIVEFEVDNFNNNDEFFTDSNSLDMIKRRKKLNASEAKDPKYIDLYSNSFSKGDGYKVTENYYPVTSAISILDS